MYRLTSDGRSHSGVWCMWCIQLAVTHTGVIYPACPYTGRRVPDAGNSAAGTCEKALPVIDNFKVLKLTYLNNNILNLSFKYNYKILN